MRFVNEIVDLFVPPLCSGCGRALPDRDVPVCMDCLLRMTRCSTAFCATTLLPFMNLAPCAAALAVSWTYYQHDSIGARFIRSMKYLGRPAMGYGLGRLFALELKGLGVRPDALFLDAELPEGIEPVDASFGITDVEMLLPVPQHWTKTLRRGFNQSRCVAMGMAAETGARVVENLIASRPHKTQTHRSGQDRLANVADSFLLENPRELDGRHIAIVDDVITTGATIRECILAIGRSGARPASLSVFSLGMAGKE